MLKLKNVDRISSVPDLLRAGLEGVSSVHR
jgi:hypothetical protein